MVGNAAIGGISRRMGGLRILGAYGLVKWFSALGINC